MSEIHYAVEMDCSDSSIIWSDTCVGIDNGIFYLITDRPGLNGSITVTGHDRQIWYEGVLTEDSLDKVYQRIDIKVAGNYSTPSSFSFKISNSEGFWFPVKNAGIKLLKRKVKFYTVIKNGSAYNFTQIWTGVIENNPFDEEEFMVNCIDNSIDIHSRFPFPPKKANVGGTITNDNQIISLNEDAKDQFLPVCIGKVNKAKALQTYSDEKIQGLNTDILGTTSEYIISYVGPVQAYDIVDTHLLGETVKEYFVTLVTGTKTYTLDQLASGYALTGVFGPDTGVYRIIGNIASTVLTGAVYKTKFQIEKELETDVNSPDIKYGSTSTRTVNVQYYKISRLVEANVIAGHEIYSYKDFIGNKNAYIIKDKKYLNVAYYPYYYSLGNGTAASHSDFITNYFLDKAGIIIDAYNENKNNSNYSTKTYYSPKNVILLSRDNGLGDWTANDGGDPEFPVVNADCPNLYDANVSTFYQNTIDMDADSGVSIQYYFEINPPKSIQEDLASFDAVYVTLTQSFNSDTGGEGLGTSDLTFWGAVAGLDAYGRRTEYIPTNLSDSLFGGSDHLLYDSYRFNSGVEYKADLIPGTHYNYLYNEATTFYSSTATSGTSSTLTKTGAGWTTNAYAGKWVSFDSGTGAGQTAKILSNTATVLTFAKRLATSASGTTVFTITNANTDFNAIKTKLDISSLLKQNNVFRAYPLIYLGLRVSADFVVDEARFEYRIYDISIIGETKEKTQAEFDPLDAEYFSSVTGAIHVGTDYVYNQYVDGDPILNIPSAMEHLMVSYEGTPLFTNDVDDEYDVLTLNELRNPLTGTRKDWFVGAQLTSKNDDGIFTYLTDLAKFGFIGIGIDNLGRRFFKAWREDYDTIYVFNETNIVRNTLENIEYIDISEIYNTFEINYDKDYGNDSWNKKLSINYVTDESRTYLYPGDSDPYHFYEPYLSSSQTEWTGAAFNGVVNSGGIYGLPEGNYYALWVDSVTAGSITITEGTYISLNGNAQGFDFNFLKVVKILNVFGVIILYVEVDRANATLPSGWSYTGTVYVSHTGLPLWKEQVSGIEDYISAVPEYTAGPVTNYKFRYLLPTIGISYTASDFLITFTSATTFSLSGGGYGALQDGTTGVEYYENITGLRFLIEPNASYNSTQEITIVVTRVDGWAIAKVLWDKCRLSYTNYKFIQKLPATFGDCYWFSDINKYDSLDETNVNNDLTKDSAYKYLEQLVDWVTIPKQMVKFSIPLTTTYLNLQLLDYVGFSDAKLTNGNVLNGWVVQKEFDPQMDLINIELLLAPTTYPTPLTAGEIEDAEILDENCSPNDEIVSETGATDIISENP